MEKVTQLQQDINNLNESLNTDLGKFIKGNKAAGTRARKYSSEIAKATKELRAAIQAVKNQS